MQIITTISEVQRAFFQAFQQQVRFRSSPWTTQANFQPVHLQSPNQSIITATPAVQFDSMTTTRKDHHLTIPWATSTALASKTEGNSPTATRGQGILEKNAVCNEIQLLYVAQERSRPQLTLPNSNSEPWGNRTSKVLKHTFASAKFNTSSTW